jgi:hypothetical protein
VRFKDHALMDLATGRDAAGTVVRLDVRHVRAGLRPARVLLPRPKVPITGPAGIQASFDFQASGADGHILTAVLSNDVATYAAAAV